MLGKFKSPRCKICNLPDSTRDLLDADLAAGMKKVDIAKKYDVSSANITNHLPHTKFDAVEKLEELIRDALYKGVEIDNVGEVLKVIQYLQGQQDELFKSGKERWDNTFEEKFRTFENIMFNEPFFNHVSMEARRMICDTVRSIFSQEAKRDIGKWIAGMLNVGDTKIENTQLKV